MKGVIKIGDTSSFSGWVGEVIPGLGVNTVERKRNSIQVVTYTEVSEVFGCW